MNTKEIEVTTTVDVELTDEELLEMVQDSDLSEQEIIEALIDINTPQYLFDKYRDNPNIPQEIRDYIGHQINREWV